jgi:hypothetical protein
MVSGASINSQKKATHPGSGSWIGEKIHPGSGTRNPDQGGKKAPVPGSGSTTMSLPVPVFVRFVGILFTQYRYIEIFLFLSLNNRVFLFFSYPVKMLSL